MKEFTETELANEQWRDIEGYDGMYQVSDLGRVRSRYSGEWRVMKPINIGSGYFGVAFYKNKKRKNVYIHRLVANAFIPNSDSSKTLINHIDECKQNNRFWNLEYCTPQYNSTYNDIQNRKKNSVRRKIAKLYNPDLSIPKNLEIFKENGIECCAKTVMNLRKNLNLEPHPNYKRHKIKDLYRPDLTIKQNIDLFKKQGIYCSIDTVKRLRRELGLVKHK